MPVGWEKPKKCYWTIVCSHKSIENPEGCTHAIPGWVEKQRGGKNWGIDLIEFLENTDIDDTGRAYIKETLMEIGQWEEKREALTQFGIE